MFLKKILFLMLTLIIISVVTVSINLSTRSKAKVVNANPQFEIIAHRGFEDMYPENTIYAAQQAVKLGTGPEFDVQFTSDGRMVVIHDYSVDRTTNGTGVVSKLNYSYIKKLDAGEKFSKQFTGLKIPEFSDYLHSIKNSAHIYPELKYYGNTKDIERFTDMILENDFEKRATILTFNYKEVLPVIRHKSRIIKVGALTKDKPMLNRNIKIAAHDKNSIILIPIELATSDTLSKCKSKNLDVVVWTIHDIDTLKKLKTTGYTRFICSRYMDVAQ